MRIDEVAAAWLAGLFLVVGILLGDVLSTWTRDPPVIDPPAVVCQEVNRSYDQTRTDRFMVTHICQLDLRGEITWQAPESNQS